MKWQPIETAPKDGTVILTDEGTGRYVGQSGWGSPVSDGWYLCSACGYIPYCADNGQSISKIDPELWMPIPNKDDE